MKGFWEALMCLQFGFVIFWQKDFGAKAAHKMLVKLTPGGKKLCSLMSLMSCASLAHQRHK
jgi:hypothetical protein